MLDACPAVAAVFGIPLGLFGGKRTYHGAIVKFVVDQFNGQHMAIDAKCLSLRSSTADQFLS